MGKMMVMMMIVMMMIVMIVMMVMTGEFTVVVMALIDSEAIHR